MPLSTGDRLGRYEILARIGAGGMGEVYRARDQRLGRQVAIKVVPDEFGADAARLSRFEHEARVLAALNHTHIAQIYGLEEDQGRRFLVLELVEGETLAQRLDRGAVPVEETLKIALQIASALEAAHERGIVHRDLKPANIMLTPDGGAKVLDFGIAKTLPEVAPSEQARTLTAAGPVTRGGMLIGTPAYMSPEQARGQPVDRRVDIWAFGVVLWEMLTGQRPFEGDSDSDTLAAILREDPAPLEQLNPQVPPGLQRLVTRCLEKRPEDRFAAVRDVACALQGVAESGDSEVAETPTRAHLSGASTPRRWRLVAAIGGGALALAAAAIGLRGLWNAPEPGSATPQPSEPPRIVVLPFENLGAAEDEYFADGITEEITSRLAAVSGLQVISRTSAMHYKDDRPPLPQIGRELDVGFVLEGTIRWDRSGQGYGRVRITPQLVRVADDTRLWSERYDRELEDIFAVQSEIAEQVIAGLQASLPESESQAVQARPTENMAAHQAYLRALEYYHSDERETLRLAAEMLERATALDPRFALAHALLSRVHSLIFHFYVDRTPERLEMARLSALRALELEPDLPQGHLALGGYYFMGYRDYERAGKEYASAARELPNDPEVHLEIYALYKRQGRWDEARRELEHTLRLDPRALDALEEGSTFNRITRDYDEAEMFAQRAVSVYPDVVAGGYELGFKVSLSRGDTRKARTLLESAPSVRSPELDYDRLLLDLYDRRPAAALARVEGLSSDALSLQNVYLPKRFLECVCLFQMAENARAREACQAAVTHLKQEIAARPKDFRLPKTLGQALALLGRNEEAVRAGERAVELVATPRDELDSSVAATTLAEIYARVGRHEQALDLIDELLSKPGFLSVGILRLDPAWDPVRDNPRFQALLAKYEVER